MYRYPRTISAAAMLLVLVACSGLPDLPFINPPEAPEVLEPVPDALQMSERTGRSDISAFTLGNSGDGDLEVTVTTDAAWLDVGPESVEIGPNELEDFIVTATCGDEPDTLTGTITLTTNDDDEPTKMVSVTLVCTVAPPTSFNIELVYSGDGITTARQQVFEQAAARWAEVITGDLSDIASATYNDLCASSLKPEGYDYTGPIDDVLIFATIEAIDGPYGTLGVAGPCLFRPGDGFPAVGMMIFDSADISNMEVAGTFPGAIQHEMGHVIDLNFNAWFAFDLIDFDQGDCLSSTVVSFTGTNAVNEWQTLGGTGFVPVENNGIQGTACSHWDEETFGTELMTGYVDLEMPLSRLTIAALDDLSYEVNYDVADAYSLPPDVPGLRTEDVMHFQEIIVPPSGMVYPDGTVVPIDPADPLMLDLKMRAH